MEDFIKYLIDNGWNSLSHNKQYSSLGTMAKEYRKEGESVVFVFGLGEAGYSPTLISPSPVSMNETESGYRLRNQDQHETFRMVHKVGFENYVHQCCEVGHVYVDDNSEWIIN